MTRGSDYFAADATILEELHADAQMEVYLTESRDAVRERRISIIYSSGTTWKQVQASSADLARAASRVAGSPARSATVLVWPSSVLAAAMRRVQGEVASSLGLTPPYVSVYSARTFHANAASAHFSISGGFEEWAPSTFVEPELEIPDGNVVNALEFIADEWIASESVSQRLLIVLAPAGVGKTTLANGTRDRLLHRIPSRRESSIPLVLRSSNWSGLRLDHATLDDIWLRAINDNYKAAVPLDTLRAFIETGTVIPILDGFDELCSFGDAFNPVDTIGALQSMVQHSESARLIVTTRESYWNSVKDNIDLTDILTVTLTQFSSQHVSSFLMKRFPGDSGELKRVDAQRMLDRISSRTSPYGGDSPSGHPLIVEMVSDAVDDGGTSEPAAITQHPVAAVLDLACRRERERRGLELSEDQQLEVFTEVAVEHRDGVAPETLSETARTFFPTLGARQREQVLPHHQLLRRNGATIHFKYDFVRDYLRASRLVSEVEGSVNLGRTAKILLGEEADGKGPFWDHLRQLGEVNREAIGRWWSQRKELNLAIHDEEDIEHLRYVSGILHLALRCVLDPIPTLPAERRAAGTALLSILSANGEIRGAVIVGNIHDVSLLGSKFVNCVFDNSGFVRCDLTGVSFDGCRFVGGFEILRCTGAERVPWPSGAGVSSGAASTFLAQKTFRSTVSSGDVETALHQLLFRFRRGNRLRTLMREDVLTTSQRRSDIFRAALEELEASGIVESHSISGRGPDAGRNIGDIAMRDVLRFLENRTVSSRLSEVVERVLRRVRAST